MIERADISKYFDKLSDNMLDKILDRIEQSKNTNGFIIQYVNDTVLIYNTYTDYYISWYKLTHIGRALQSNITRYNDFLLFMNELIEDIEEDN